MKIENPDTIIDIRKKNCNCGCNLSGIEGEIQTRQVVDIPNIVMSTTEYKIHKLVCPNCNEIHTTEFPATVSQPVSMVRTCRL